MAKSYQEVKKQWKMKVIVIPVAVVVLRTVQSTGYRRKNQDDPDHTPVKIS